MKEYFFYLFFNTIFIDLSLPFYILWINKIQEIFLWTSFPRLALSFQSTFANFLHFEKLRTHLSFLLSQGTKVMKSNLLEKESFWNNFNTDISLSILLAKASFGFLLISMLFYWFQTTFKFDTQRALGSGGIFLGKLPLLTMWSANLTLISLLSIRWIESGHFPLSNLYESLLFLSWSLTTIHLFLENTLNKREKARISPLVSMQSNTSLPLLFVGAQLSEILTPFRGKSSVVPSRKVLQEGHVAMKAGLRVDNSNSEALEQRKSLIQLLFLRTRSKSKMSMLRRKKEADNMSKHHRGTSFFPLSLPERPWGVEHAQLNQNISFLLQKRAHANIEDNSPKEESQSPKESISCKTNLLALLPLPPSEVQHRQQKIMPVPGKSSKSSLSKQKIAPNSLLNFANPKEDSLPRFAITSFRTIASPLGIRAKTHKEDKPFSRVIKIIKDLFAKGGTSSLMKKQEIKNSSRYVNWKSSWSQRQRVDSSITLGAITSPLALFTNAFATFSLPQDMQKATVLVPALQSNWLIMHVSVMILSYAALLSGSLLAVAFLIIKFVDDNKGSVNIPFFSNSILGIRKSQFLTPSCLLFPPYTRSCSASFGRLAVPKVLLKVNDVPSFYSHASLSSICSDVSLPEARKRKEALHTPWHKGLTPLEVCVMGRRNKSHFYGYSSSSARGTEATYSFINPFVLEKQKFTNIEDLLLVRNKSSISTKQVKTLSKVEEISQAPDSYASLWKAQVASSSYLLTSLIHSSRTPTLCYPKQVSPKTYTTEKADEISFLRPLPVRGLGSWQSKNGLVSRMVLDSPTQLRNPFGVRRFAAFPTTEDSETSEQIKDINAPKEENQSPIQNLLQILDNLSYRSIGLGFAFLTIGILSGAVWANEAWGSYWNWDPKETWAFITWLIFALYLHTRLSKGWVGKESAFVATFGFVIIWFCYLGVNLFGKGLHSYGWFHTIQ